jgi:hypothetical protein
MLLLTLIALSAATPRADATQAEQHAQAYLARGEKLLRDGDFENALWNFQQANARYPNAASALGAAECYERLGEKAYAVYYYRAYLRRSPGAPDGLEVAERVSDVLFSELQNGRGLLEVEAPLPAKVSVDGRPIGALPIAAFLPLGEHELTVEFPTGTQRRVVSLKRGKLTTSLSLEPPPEITRTVANISSTSTSSTPTSAPSQEEEGPKWMVISHPGLASRISSEKLREIFSGEVVASLEGQIVQVVLPGEGSPARNAFLLGFLGKTNANFQASWVKLLFRGAGARPPLELLTDADVVKAVRSQPGTIGIVAAGIEIAGVTRVSIR